MAGFFVLTRNWRDLVLECGGKAGTRRPEAWGVSRFGEAAGLG